MHLYVVDLGLVKSRPLRMANPIYQEVVARVLSSRLRGGSGGNRTRA